MPNAPTWTNLNTTNSHCLLPLCESARWQQQNCDCQNLWCHESTTSECASAQFPVFEEHWDPNAVITLADDQGGTLDVKLLELLCLTRTRYKSRVARALKKENDCLAKSINREFRSIWSKRNKQTVNKPWPGPPRLYAATRELRLFSFSSSCFCFLFHFSTAAQLSAIQVFRRLGAAIQKMCKIGGLFSLPQKMPKKLGGQN